MAPKSRKSLGAATLSKKCVYSSFLNCS